MTDQQERADGESAEVRTIPDTLQTRSETRKRIKIVEFLYIF